LVPKLRTSCYAVRSISHISNIDILKSIYFAFFHSLMKYQIIFWGNSSESKKVFTLQKKTVTLMTSVKSCISCRDLFKRLEIFTLPCENIFSPQITNNIFRPLQTYTVLTTRHKHYLHKPNANLSCSQKSAHYAGSKIFNNLPSDFKSLMMRKHNLK
jgi:hypothetical protein